MDKPNYVIDAENYLAKVLGDPATDQPDIEQAQQDLQDALADWDAEIADWDEVAA